LHVGETKPFQIQGCLATNVCQIAIKVEKHCRKNMPRRTVHWNKPAKDVRIYYFNLFIRL